MDSTPERDEKAANQKEEPVDELERLKDVTYSLHHNPNCPSPYQIRLIGKGRAILDHRYFGTKDRLYWGKTLKDAVDRAVKAK